MDKKIQVLVVGCNGAMGQIVCRLISESDDMEVYAGFDKAARELMGFPVLETIDGLKDFIVDHGEPDVIIDFSQHDNTMDMLRNISLPYTIPTVIATTGFSTEETAEIESIAKDTPIFMSSNMSYEIKLLSDLLKDLSPKLFGTHEFEIVETHHSRKKDAPSGTAKTLAKVMQKSVKDSIGEDMTITYGRTGKREPNEIGIASLRGGNIVGEHTIRFCGQSDELLITHRAFSREMFAEGALKAARFIKCRTWGRLYGMDDLE